MPRLAIAARFFPLAIQTFNVKIWDWIRDVSACCGASGAGCSVTPDCCAGYSCDTTAKPHVCIASAGLAHRTSTRAEVAPRVVLCLARRHLPDAMRITHAAQVPPLEQQHLPSMKASFSSRTIAWLSLVACGGSISTGDGGSDAASDMILDLDANVPDVDDAGVIATIAGGWGCTCAVSGGGSAMCWGEDTQAFCSGLFDAWSPPMDFQGPPPSVGSFALGDLSAAVHNCAVSPDGALYCWGDNQFGELGSGTASGPQQVDLGRYMPWGCRPSRPPPAATNTHAHLRPTAVFTVGGARNGACSVSVCRRADYHRIWRCRHASHCPVLQAS